MSFHGPNLDITKLKADRVVINDHLELVGDTNSTDAGAIDVDTPITYITQTGSAETRTLGVGHYEGQVKVLICTVYAADTVVTAALEGSHNTITFNAQGDSWMGIWHAGEWWTLMLGFSSGTGPAIG